MPTTNTHDLHAITAEILMAASKGDLDIIKGYGEQIDFTQLDSDANKILNIVPSPTPEEGLIFFALLLAAGHSNIDVIHYLLEKSFALNLSNPLHANLFVIAAKNKLMELIQHFLIKGKNVDLPEHSNWLIWTLAQNGHLSSIIYLVSQGASLTIKNDREETLIFVASKHGHLDVVQYLMGQGCNLDTHNTMGETPLGAALEKNHLAVAQLLLENGANHSDQETDLFLKILFLDDAQYQSFRSIMIQNDTTKITLFYRSPLEKTIDSFDRARIEYNAQFLHDFKLNSNNFLIEKIQDTYIDTITSKQQTRLSQRVQPC